MLLELATRQDLLAGNSGASVSAIINAFANSPSTDLLRLGVKNGSLAETVRFKIGGTGTVTMYNHGGHSLIAYNDAGTKILQLENSGMLRAREIKVDEASWPDYVFDKNYKLPKLKDVAKYIDENHHLPGVPSAAEIEADGLNLGDMQNIQMQKIEELTLYMIEMEKRIEALEKENEELKKLNIK
jgi:hypothetical protein